MEKLLNEVEIKTLNKFGQFELTASQTYLFLANRMKTLSCFGAEKLFNGESDGERYHYRKIEKFMNDLGCELSVEALDKADHAISNIKEALELAYMMEKDLLDAYETAARNSELSLKVVLLLQDFTTHQVSAVGEFSDLLARIELTNDMLLFDKELGN